MNPAFGARLSQSVAQPSIALNAAAAPPKTNAAERKQVFVDAAISEAVGGGGVRDADLTALLREVDRLVQYWPDEVRGLGLAEDLSPAVRQLLTAAVERAGLTVIEYQPSSCSFHVHATEMKRPQSEDADDVVGPELHVAVHVPPVPPVPSRTTLENIDAIEGVLNLHCSRARAQGGADDYQKASRAREAVIEAVLHGVTDMELDLPASLVTELAPLGLMCRPTVPVELAQQLRDLRRAMQANDAFAVTAGMHGLKVAGLERNQLAKLLGESEVLGGAMAGGHAAAVTAFMDALKPAGLSSSDIEGLVINDRNSRSPGPLQCAAIHGHAAAVTAFIDALIQMRFKWIFNALLSGIDCALSNGHAAAVTALMEGITRARLHPAHVYVLLRDDTGQHRFLGCLGVAVMAGHAAAVTAFTKGLPGSGLTQRDIADIIKATGGHGLQLAMGFGKAAAVTAYMEGLKVIGLSPHQIVRLLGGNQILRGSVILRSGIESNQPAAVTAFIGGLQGAGLSPNEVYALVEVDRVFKVESNAGWQAYRDGLNLLARQQLITPDQLSDLQARAMAMTESKLP